MIRRAAAVGLVLVALAACRREPPAASRARADAADLTPTERDTEALGHEIFEMVDRAVDYRGSHRGRPAASFKQMGIDSLTPTTVRRVVNVDREPVVTVEFRRPDGHEIVSCRGDSSILEDAAVGGRFTIMCTTSAGAQRPIEVGADAPEVAS